jgi:hypothetical protein
MTFAQSDACIISRLKRKNCTGQLATFSAKEYRTPPGAIQGGHSIKCTYPVNGLNTKMKRSLHTFLYSIITTNEHSKNNNFDTLGFFLTMKANSTSRQKALTKKKPHTLTHKKITNKTHPKKYNQRKKNYETKKEDSKLNLHDAKCLPNAVPIQECNR